MKLVWGIALALATAACVNGGDDTSDAATQGSLGGACFPNNTCNPNLVCTLVNGKGICEAGDASVQDAPNDSPTSDAPTDAPAGDGSDGGCNAQITLPCGNQQCHAQNKGCCEKLGQCGDATFCNGSPYFDCESNADCNGAGPCCINAQFNPNTCPISTQATGLQVTCSTSTVCPSGANQLCLISSDCPQPTTCKPFTIDGNVYGVCM